MNEVTEVLESIVTIALNDNGWSFLRPVMSDGSLGPQIDSTDVAEMVTIYLLLAFQGGNK